MRQRPSRPTPNRASVKATENRKKKKHALFTKRQEALSMSIETAVKTLPVQKQGSLSEMGLIVALSESVMGAECNNLCEISTRKKDAVLQNSSTYDKLPILAGPLACCPQEPGQVGNEAAILVCSSAEDKARHFCILPTYVVLS